MLPGHLGIVLRKHISRSPRPTARGFRHPAEAQGTSVGIPSRLFLLPREYLNHEVLGAPWRFIIPPSLLKASYCAGKPPNCGRPGRQRANAKGSIRNATVPVIGFVGCRESWFCYVSVHFPLLIPGLCLAGHASQLLVCWRFRAETRSSTVRSAQRQARATRLPFLAWLKRCPLLTELYRSQLHHYLTCCSGEDLPAVLQLKA